MNFPILFLAAATGLIPLVPKKAPSTALAVMSAPLKHQHLLSPVLHVNPGVPNSPHVALTFDACTGKVDDRILSTLINNRIKATVFVTARWLKRNPVALGQMLTHADLFEIENHGARHLAAIDHPAMLYTLKAAGSPAGLRSEILDGAAAVKSATGREPRWYRGAGAEYSSTAVSQIISLNFKLAGYSLSGDGGAGYSTKRAATAVANAKNGDVIIAHINQPAKPAGAGVAEGVLALKAKGFVFVRLDEHHIAH